jgi:hypothetical protein
MNLTPKPGFVGVKALHLVAETPFCVPPIPHAWRPHLSAAGYAIFWKHGADLKRVEC